MPVNELISGMLRGEGGFQRSLKHILTGELEMSVNEFCRISGVSQSTMYKILEEGREPNLKTVRMIVKALRSLTEPSGVNFIAVIAAHEVLLNLDKEKMIDGRKVILREFPVTTVEDAIVAAVRAERGGALAIVCAPIVVTTVEKIVSIPVSPAIPTESINIAIEKVKKDLWGRYILRNHIVSEYDVILSIPSRVSHRSGASSSPMPHWHLHLMDGKDCRERSRPFASCSRTLWAASFRSSP